MSVTTDTRLSQDPTGDRRHRLAQVLLALVVGWVLVFTLPSLAAKAAESAATPHTVVLANIRPLGMVLVTAKHFVLYEFTADQPNVSHCQGSCAAAWPPYLLSKSQKLHAPKNVHGLSTIHRGHRAQVTINGHPLYLFSGDRRPGQVHGQGVENAWFVVGPSGQAVGAAAPASATTVPSVSSPASTPPTAAVSRGSSSSTANSTTKAQGNPSPTSPPATSPPVTAAPGGAPVTTPPVTSPPVTSPPVTSPPVTTPPVTTPPVTTPPVTTPTGGGGGGGYGY